MDGKKLNAKRQTRFKNSMRQTGKVPITVWVESETKNELGRVKELLECNNNDAFDAVMRFIGTLNDEYLLEQLRK